MRISLSTKRPGSTEAHRRKTFLWERHGCSHFMPDRSWFTDKSPQKTEHPEKVLSILQFPAISEPFRNVVGSCNRYYANFAISPLFLTIRSGHICRRISCRSDPLEGSPHSRVHALPILQPPCPTTLPRAALPLDPLYYPYVLPGITGLREGRS